MSGSPRDLVELRLLLLWEQALDRRCDLDTDFFAAGGSSLLAAALLSGLSVDLGIELSLDHLADRPTAAAFAASVRSTTRDIPQLVEIRRGRTAAELCFCPDATGGVGYLRPCSRTDTDPSIVGLHTGAATPAGTSPGVEGWAAMCADLLRTQRPGGGYVIAARGAGWALAWELAGQLTAAGENVDGVLLLDVAPAGAGPLRSDERRDFCRGQHPEVQAQLVGEEPLAHPFRDGDWAASSAELRSAGRILPDEEPTALAGRAAAAGRRLAVLRDYRPTPLPVRVLIGLSTPARVGTDAAVKSLTALADRVDTVTVRGGGWPDGLVDLNLSDRAVLEFPGTRDLLHGGAGDR